MLQNAYLVAKIGADTAENEQHLAEILPRNGRRGYEDPTWPRRPCRAGSPGCRRPPGAPPRCRRRSCAKFGFILGKDGFCLNSISVQRSGLCRSRRELSNAYLLAKIGVDTAENEPSKVCPIERCSTLSEKRCLTWRSNTRVMSSPKSPAKTQVKSNWFQRISKYLQWSA